LRLPTEVTLETSTCPMGCAPDDEPLFTGVDRLHGLPGEFTIVRCRACDLLRTDPRPTAETIGFYYPADYGPYNSAIVGTEASTVRKRSKLWKVLSRACRLNTEIVPNLPPGRLLEVGCASGGFMAVMAARGWSVSGIEFDEGATARAREAGLDVQAAAIENATPPERPVDLAVAWMVVEHMHDPLFGLRRLAQWTTPSGWLALSVPDVSSLDFKLFGPDNYALHLPNHLYHFTPKTITALLDRAGWKVERIYHQRMLGNYFGSLGNWLQSRELTPRLAQLLRRLPERSGYFNHFLLPLSVPLALFGQTGRMTVWARKKPSGT
jgi:SAM-dependent methyltransferase